MDVAFGRKKRAARTAGRLAIHLLALLLYGALTAVLLTR